MEADTLKAAGDATRRWKDLEAQLKQAKADRDDAIRAADADGWEQKDIVTETGLTRETIRRIVNPEAAEAVKRAAAEKRRAAKKEIRS